MTRELLSEKDFFETSDLSLVATLRYFGIFEEAINKQNLSKVLFVIRRDKDSDQVKEGYWKRQLVVEPMSFFNCIKEVKSKIYSEK